MAAIIIPAVGLTRTPVEPAGVEQGERLVVVVVVMPCKASACTARSMTPPSSSSSTASLQPATVRIPPLLFLLPFLVQVQAEPPTP